MAYKNLRKELDSKGISNRAVAALIGMDECTFRDKMKKGNFFIGEAFLILRNLFPQYSIDYLFYEENDSDSEPIDKAS